VNEAYNIFTGLRDQLRNQIVGTSASYNFRLKRDQVKEGWINPEQTKYFPVITIGAMSVNLTQMTIGGPSFWVPLSVEVNGYVKDPDDAFGEALKLLSDIETALREDLTLGGLVYDLAMVSDATSMDQLGVVSFSLTMKYNIEQSSS